MLIGDAVHINPCKGVFINETRASLRIACSILDKSSVDQQLAESSSDNGISRTNLSSS